MIDPGEARDFFAGADVTLFTGVPDSLLKEFNAAIADSPGNIRHIVAPNEGNAVGVAAGHYLATGRLALVYMQNSGLGNAVNPLASLASPTVHGIPMLLMVGWRGEPDVSDAPQHALQGRITPEILRSIGLPVHQLTPETSDWGAVISAAVDDAKRNNGPAALLVSKGTFYDYARKAPVEETPPIRPDAMAVLLDHIDPDTLVVATTGYTSRELATLRESRGEEGLDFLTVGSMGHASSIALGAALANPGRRVVCLDGDGAYAMHMGAVAMIGQQAPPNLGHILFDNGVHESVGSQPSALVGSDPAAVALACGYVAARTCANLGDFEEALLEMGTVNGPWLLHMKVGVGTLPGLERPSDFVARVRRLREQLGAG